LKGLEPPLPPWHNRFPLTAEEAARVVATDVPELAPCTAEHLGEGWDYATFRVDHEWVFRFPKRRQAGRALLREVRTLRELRATAELPLAVPAYRWVIETSRAFPAPYAGYAFLPGLPLLSLDAGAVDVEAVGRTLGAFLGRLHASAPSARPRIAPDDFAAYFADFRADFAAVEDALPAALAGACRVLLANAPMRWRGPAVFVHGDLGAEHVLCEPNGRPTAVIDWGDAGWGNPLGDFVGLWAWGGDAAAGAALAAAGRTLYAGEWQRLRLWGACYALGTFRYGYKDGQEALTRPALEWLARMERTGQLHDPGRCDA
jgi:aminoglycoside phosphotransferase (APT) family kinase protein